MRVRVSYGMDISDVPSKVSELLCETTDKLEEALELLERCRDGVEDCEGDFSHFTNLLDNTRQRLANIDLAIQDAEYILSGLNNHYNGEQQNVSNRRSTMDTSGDTAEETKTVGPG